MYLQARVAKQSRILRRKVGQKCRYGVCVKLSAGFSTGVVMRKVGFSDSSV